MRYHIDTHDLNIFCAYVSFHVGSIHEPAKLRGISHFLEHMKFKRTAELSPSHLLKGLDDIGAFYNAETIHDRTSYYIYSTTSSATQVLNILFQIAIHSRFHNNQIDAERKVVLEEGYSARDNPDDVYTNALFQSMYPASNPYSHPIIGTVAALKRISNKDFEQFSRLYYHVDSSIFIYCNRSIETRIRRQLRKHIGTIPQTPLLSWQRCLLKADSAMYKTIDMRRNIVLKRPHAAQYEYTIVWEGWSADNHKSDLAEILAFCLTGNTNKPLSHEIRERLGLVYGIRAFHETSQHNGRFIIHWETSNPNIISIVESIVKVLAGLVKNASHFPDYIRQYLLNREIKKSSPQWYVPHMANKHFYNKSLEDTHIQCEDVVSLLKEILNDRRCMMATRGHYKSSKDVLDKLDRSLQVIKGWEGGR
jgi:predicted Zn-dependent peptidase